MSCEIETASQAAASLDLSFVKGDSFSMTITFPFDITSYTVSARIGSFNMSSAKIGTTQLTLSISAINSATLNNFDLWYLKLTKAADVRTYIRGKYVSFTVC